MPISKEALAFAIARLDEFKAIHESSDFPAKIEAMRTLREYLGITDEVLNDFIDWLVKFGAEGYEGGALFGLMVGLYINEFEN